MIAGQKPESLEALAQGDSDDDAYAAPRGIPATENEMIEMASYVNNRNVIIATMAMILFVSVVTNVLFVVAR